MIKNIILSGVGGQGILLAAKIIAHAAMQTSFEVTTNEIHGMAQRGGSVTAQIRYGTQLHSPLILEGTADVLGALEQIEAIRYAHYLKPQGLAVVSSQAIIPVTVSSGKATYPQDVEARLNRIFPRLKFIDCPRMALERQDARLANTIMLGALSNGLDLPEEAWIQALGICIKPSLLEANIEAFQAGKEA